MLRYYLVPFLITVPVVTAAFAWSDIHESGRFNWGDLFTFHRLILYACSVAILGWVNIRHLGRLRSSWMKKMRDRLEKDDAIGAETIAARIIWLYRMSTLQNVYITPFDLLGHAANGLNDYPLAEYYQKRSLTIGSGHWAECHKADVYNNLGDTLGKAQRFVEAETYFRQALTQIDKGFSGFMLRATVLINLAEALVEQNRLEEGKKLLQEAWQQPALHHCKDQAAFWHYVQSGILERERRFDEAREAAQTALEGLPKSQFESLHKNLEERLNRLGAKSYENSTW